MAFYGVAGQEVFFFIFGVFGSIIDFGGNLEFFFILQFDANI